MSGGLSVSRKTLAIPLITLCDQNVAAHSALASCFRKNESEFYYFEWISLREIHSLYMVTNFPIPYIMILGNLSPHPEE
jgi:hypothetical protein